MKRCAVCLFDSDDATCPMCGEASWVEGAAKPLVTPAVESQADELLGLMKESTSQLGFAGATQPQQEPSVKRPGKNK